MIVEWIEMIVMGNLMIVMGMVVVVVSVVIMFWFVVMFLVMMLLENILKSHDLVTRECVKEEFTLHFSLSMTHSS